MKKEFIIAVSLLSLLSCKKDKNATTTSSNSKTIQYSFTGTSKQSLNAYYYDADGKQVNVNAKSGWIQTVEMKSGSTAVMGVGAYTQEADTVKAVIRFNGQIVASDSSNKYVEIQYVVK